MCKPVHAGEEEEDHGEAVKHLAVLEPGKEHLLLGHTSIHKLQVFEDAVEQLEVEDCSAHLAAVQQEPVLDKDGLR